MKKFLTVTLVLLIYLMTGCASSVPEEPGPKLPIELPFAVHQAGATVSTELRIVERYRGYPHNYPFDLVFIFGKGDEVDRARVRKLTGGGGTINGQPAEPGIQIPLKITIHFIDASGEKLFLEKEIITRAIWAWRIDRFYRNIDTIHMPPGLYRVTVMSLKNIPELAGTKVTLYISLRRGE